MGGAGTRGVVAALVACGAGVAATADDWPQWMGPGRDNVWRERGLVAEFPEAGPPVVWRAEVGSGYAGPAVAGGRVFLMDYRTDADIGDANFGRSGREGVEGINAFDEATGERLWRHEYVQPYGISYPSGPRCTPIVEGDRVYALGAEGRLTCLSTVDGSVAWEVDLKQRYGAESPLWGYSAHPLIDGERLYTLAGGTGSHLVALHKRTGEELWRAGSGSEQGYSPPTIIEAFGRRQLIAFAPDGVAALDPETGAELWRQAYGATNGSAIMSPVTATLNDDTYLYVAGYAEKNLLLKLTDAPGAERVFRDAFRKGLSPVNVQPIVAPADPGRMDRATMFGVGQRGKLTAVDLPSGERLWEESSPIGRRAVSTGTAFLVRDARGDGLHWLFTENGELILARLTRDGYQEIDRAKLLDTTNVAFGREVVWSMPAFANRRVYARNDRELICVDLADTASGG